MQIVVLAGGRGTRLGEEARTIPKPMVTIGGRPNLEHQVMLAKRYGFTNVLFLVSHLADVIRAYFGDGRHFGVDISYSIEDSPLGTAGALGHAGSRLDERFLLVYGDIFVDCDVGRLWADHADNRAIATLVVHPNDHPYDSDLIEADAEGWISTVHPKSRSKDQYLPNMVNAAVSVVERDMLRWIPPNSHLDLATDTFRGLARHRLLRAYRSAEYFKDFGTPDRLAQVRCDFEIGKPARLSRSSRRPAVFLDRDGVINKEVSHLSDPTQMELIPGAAGGIRRLNEAGYLVIVVTNQSVVARGECSLHTLRLIHNKMETLLGRERAWVDALYFCPHHPEKGFPHEIPELKIDCFCRKPKTGMFEQAIADWNISLQESCVVGDSRRDVIAAHRLGIPAIGVKTGQGCSDCDALEPPDSHVDDLAEAVSTILARGHVYPIRRDRALPTRGALG
jgi:mannose-1-phosphate guanylyltransferase / phosphomannomutase